MNEPTDHAGYAKDKIAPVALVKSDAVATASRWEIVPAYALLGAAVVVALIAVVTLRLWLARRKLDPRELAFVRLARRLRLSRTQRALVRELARAGGEKKKGQDSEAARSAREDLREAVMVARRRVSVNAEEIGAKAERSDSQRAQPSVRAVCPVVLLLSEHAFLGAANVARSASSRDQFAQLQGLQRKIFAGKG